MIDANGLKLINDAYGHHVGDELLKELANVIEIVFHDGYIFRWGGDEFIIIMDRTNQQDMQEKYQHFHDLIEQVKIKKTALSAALGYYLGTKEDQDIYKMINQAEKYMYEKKTYESLSAKRIIIDNILQTLYDSYKFEQKHSENVMNYAVLIGKEMKLGSSDLNKLRLAALLHDIGKIGIADNIINKPEPLSEEDQYEINQHPEKGFRILSAYPELSEYGTYVLAHHEFYNGQGYPRQLKGEDIPLFSRIIGVADAYDAMIEPRPYKKSKTKEEAIKELQECSGKQFDPKIVKHFIEAINKKDA